MDAQDIGSLIEFSGLRSSLYHDAMRRWPTARICDIELLLGMLAPKRGEYIVELGSGTGFFTRTVAAAVAPGCVLASDPSACQMQGLDGISNVMPIVAGADTIVVDDDRVKKHSFDAAFSFGAIHHCHNKTRAFNILNTILKDDGRLVIIDVFQGSTLAYHFDQEVARYCVCGHEVAFLNRDFASSLCSVTGFSPPSFIDVVQRWRFATKGEIGTFLFALHAMTKSSPDRCLAAAESILGVEEDADGWHLNWPLTVMTTRKAYDASA